MWQFDANFKIFEKFVPAFYFYCEILFLLCIALSLVAAFNARHTHLPIIYVVVIVS